MLDVLVVTGYIYHLLAALVHDCACIQRLHFTDKLTLTPQLFVVISAIEFFLEKVKNQLAKVSETATGECPSISYLIKVFLGSFIMILNCVANLTTLNFLLWLLLIHSFLNRRLFFIFWNRLPICNDFVDTTQRLLLTSLYKMTVEWYFLILERVVYSSQAGVSFSFLIK